MDEALQTLAATQGNVILRPQALDAGYVDHEITRLREGGEWITVRRGAYMQRSVWDTLDEMGRHRALAHAVVLQLDEPAVASHVTPPCCVVSTCGAST